MTRVAVKAYPAPPISEKEILRYARCAAPREAERETLGAVITEAEGEFCYSVCYAYLPVTVTDGVCDFGEFAVHSRALAKNLSGCKLAVLFAASVGARFERLLAKYARLSPVKALFLDAHGSERVEALADAFCAELKEKHGALAPRFSPGYADLALSVQRDVFALLSPENKIGLTLGDGLLMSPSKSVTAFVGIRGEDK